MEPWHKTSAVEFTLVNAGYFWSDGGAAMGILPKTIWQKTCVVDDKNRIKFELDLLLIRYEDKLALVDTGLGERISEKFKIMASASDFVLIENLKRINIEPENIDFVILTHLHADHAGGIISGIDHPYLTFPQALHIIQTDEWKIAHSPDLLNKAAYDFPHNLSLLADKGNYLLIDGDYELFPGVLLKKLGGHTEGLQGLRIEGENEIIYYPADLFPVKQLISSSLVSAYDVCRKDSFRIKSAIIEDVKKHKGRIILNHDPETKFIDYQSLR